LNFVELIYIYINLQYTSFCTIMMLLKKNSVLLRKHFIQLPRQFEKVWILLTMMSESRKVKIESR
jgi:hypothetical protein